MHHQASSPPPPHPLRRAVQVLLLKMLQPDEGTAALRRILWGAAKASGVNRLVLLCAVLEGRYIAQRPMLYLHHDDKVSSHSIRGFSVWQLIHASWNMMFYFMIFFSFLFFPPNLGSVLNDRKISQSAIMRFRRLNSGFRNKYIYFYVTTADLKLLTLQ